MYLNLYRGAICVFKSLSCLNMYRVSMCIFKSVQRRKETLQAEQFCAGHGIFLQNTFSIL